MKKTLALLLALLMVLSLAACAASQPAAPTEETTPTPTEESTAAPAETAEPEADPLPYEGVSLNFWFPPYSDHDQAYWDARLEKFTAETGATVTTTIVPWGDMSAKYLAGFMSGDGPDVFYMHQGLTYDMVDVGALLDLNQYFTADELADRLYWSSGNVLGGQYEAPYCVDFGFRGMIYNMDLLKAAGVEDVPSTWDEFIDAAVKIKDASVCEYPVVYTMGEESNAVMDSFMPLVWNAGGDIVTADGTKAIIGEEPGQRAIQFLYDLVYTYGVLSTDCTSIDANYATELFAQGKVAMMPVKGAVLYNHDDMDFEYKVTLGITDGDKDLYCFYPMDYMSVNANSKNVDAAVTLLKWITSAESNAAFRADLNPTQINLLASEPEMVYEQEWAAENMPLLAKSGRNVPISKGTSSQNQVVFTNLQLLILGELSPEECAAAMQSGVEATLTD